MILSKMKQLDKEYNYYAQDDMEILQTLKQIYPQTSTSISMLNIYFKSNLIG